MRAVNRDLLCVVILCALALVAPRLEPSYRDLWTFLPLVTAIPLLISGILLLFDSKVATIGAMLIHALMLVTFGLILSGSLLLLVTILYAGTALVIGGPAALLAVNSAATLVQSFRKLRRTATILLAAVALVHCTPLRPTEAAAVDAVRRYDEAWLRKDSAAFAATISPQYVYFSSEGKVSDREAMLALLTSPDYTIEGTRSGIEARISGSVAVVATRWQGRGAYKGKPFVDDQRCSVIVSLDGRPLVIAEHCTNIHEQ